MDHTRIDYVLRQDFKINCGFPITAQDVNSSILETSAMLRLLPVTLYRAIDYKAISGIVGAIFLR